MANKKYGDWILLMLEGNDHPCHYLPKGDDSWRVTGYWVHFADGEIKHYDAYEYDEESGVVTFHDWYQTTRPKASTKPESLMSGTSNDVVVAFQVALRPPWIPVNDMPEIPMPEGVDEKKWIASDNVRKRSLARGQKDPSGVVWD